MTMKLSIIVPAYNEEENIDAIYNNIVKNLEEINFEVIFIDDGSEDKTVQVLESVYKKDPNKVRVISFSRNFGKDSAIYAGIEHSSGEYTAIIDADMEQDPKYLVKMLEFLEENKDYDQVAMTIKKRKSGNFIKKLGGKLFYKVMNLLSDTKFKEDASDFRMFNMRVKNAILDCQEKNRFSKGLFNWIGFNTKCMEYEVGTRTKGKTKFNLMSSIKYGIEGIVGFSTRPLRLATIFGTVTSLIGFIYLVYVIIKTAVVGIDTPGFATIVCLILFLGGIQLISIGILGEYISKMFMETKNRPIYITKKRLGFEDDIL